MDSLGVYINEVNNFPLLTGVVERALVERIKEGDVAARDDLIRANLRVVVNMALTYQGRGLGLADLIEEGNSGLLRAVDEYGVEEEQRFSTFAGARIRRAIERALFRRL
jgi:RNA polymerase primary sigma factor